ncbi:MAG: DMT family transporter [Candidatus Bathyarchaeota archaeon]|nr:DMT family transporter [Candidatus Bathyarchaeota archaeon]
MNGKQKGVLFTLLTSLTVAIGAVLLKLNLELVSVEMANLLFSGFCSVFFIGILLLYRGQGHFSAIAKNWRKLALFSLLGTSALLLNTYGIFIAGPVNAAFLGQFAAVFTILLGFFFLKERFTKQEGTGILFAVIGVFIMAYSGFNAEIVGIAIFLTVAFLFAVSNLISKIFVAKIPPIALAGSNSFFGLLFMSLFMLLFTRVEPKVPSLALFYTFFGALLGGVIGFILFYKALQVFEVSKTVAIRTADPFLTAVFSFIFLSLTPTVNQLVGGAFIVVGVILISLAKPKNVE